MLNNGCVMGISTFNTGDSWNDVHKSAYGPTIDTQHFQFLNLNVIFGSVKPSGQTSFRGRLEIPGLPVVPEQDFTVEFAEDDIHIENHPADSWPRIRIHFESDPSLRVRVKDFALNLANNTVDG